jgi:hypothetical protein
MCGVQQFQASVSPWQASMGNLSAWHTQADVVGGTADRTSVCPPSHWRHDNNPGTALSPASHRYSPAASVLPCPLGCCALEQPIVHEREQGLQIYNKFTCMPI